MIEEQNDPTEPIDRRPTWGEVRKIYETTPTTLRALAETTGISFSTIAKRSKRERWIAFTGKTRGDQVGLGEATRAAAAEAARAAAIEAATKGGAALGLSVVELEETSLRISKRFLDKVNAELDKPDLKADELRKLAGTCDTAIQLARQTHRMDTAEANRPTPLIDIKILARLANDPHAVREISQRRTERTTPLTE